MRLRSILIVPLLMILRLALFAQAAPAATEPVTWYRVTRVVDGDTFWVDDGSCTRTEDQADRR
ncbi:MAG: hypothetical protein MZV63_39395 [Marinilabiliales bacterium]|nr:hypothetical protein [Marinilabiliales bacterium]